MDLTGHPDLKQNTDTNQFTFCYF